MSKVKKHWFNTLIFNCLHSHITTFIFKPTYSCIFLLFTFQWKLSFFAKKESISSTPSLTQSDRHRSQRRIVCHPPLAAGHVWPPRVLNEAWQFLHLAGGVLLKTKEVKSRTIALVERKLPPFWWRICSRQKKPIGSNKTQTFTNHNQEHISFSDKYCFWWCNWYFKNIHYVTIFIITWLHWKFSVESN